MKIKIIHNPFTVETAFWVNDELTQDSIFDSYSSRRFQEWIENFFTDLEYVFNFREFEIEFRGIPTDCEDMRQAVEQANQQGFNVQISLDPVAGAEERLQQVAELYQEAESSELMGNALRENPNVRADLQEAIHDKNFDVFVVATMSSGKSTVINAMLGCELLPALNEATTATIAKIMDNDQMPLGEFKVWRSDADGQSIDGTQMIRFSGERGTAEQAKNLLADWNRDKTTHTIYIEGKIGGIQERENVCLVVSDTPGPNNSQDNDHALATQRHLKDTKKNPLILYVLNAQQLGINDDQRLLQDIAEIMKEGGKQSKDRFIFVLNKADVFDPEKGEHIEGVVARAKVYLENIVKSLIIQSIQSRYKEQLVVELSKTN
ncbi:dynamin family protein [Suttonella ornithocola]|uniref:GTPase Era n=1 Tax=Suttonella ornithocola TaxID=279832 RepID=A0A380N0U2_9GAMM|nr:dynamin family protein [Suttonella ornithocola]SUO97906.1 GTPase Era [Suttonella ornithocola]